jgi:GAF domain-containing protein
MEDICGNSNIPETEQQRILALKRYNIANTAPEKAFDNIASLATMFFDLPIGLISFIDQEQVYLKSHIGVEGITSAPRNSSICSKAILTDNVTVLEDISRADACFLVDPLLAGEMGFKFYAGAPLITEDGFRIGTICVLGMEPRKFSSKEENMLKGLSRIVMDTIELRLQGMAFNDEIASR